MRLGNCRGCRNWSRRRTQHKCRTGYCPDGRVEVGLRMCCAVGRFWRNRGYYAEARRWDQRAVDLADSRDDPLLALCLTGLARDFHLAGDLDRAREHASASVEMHRRLAATQTMPRALNALAEIESARQDAGAARPLYQEAIALTRLRGDRASLAMALSNFGLFEASERHYENALQSLHEALTVF